MVEELLSDENGLQKLVEPGDRISACESLSGSSPRSLRRSAAGAATGFRHEYGFVHHGRLRLCSTGLAAKANYNVGIGHTFGFLKKDPFGDELTFGYTYEDAGSGFWHSQFGSHTESAGIMKNFGLPGTKRIAGYTWIQLGITSFTGNVDIENHFYNGESLGAIVHFNARNSIWIQESFNKVVSVPWYTTTSIGYTWSW